jgi:hypothetical protein
MATRDHERDAAESQEKRIQALKDRARRLAGGAMTTWESDALSADQREDYWRRIVEYEAAAFVTDAQRLADGGIDLPNPAVIDDAELSAKLWEVIRALARLRVFLMSTDHLSDRELYERLWSDVLREEHPVVPDDPSASYVDLVGSGSEEDTFAWLKYYADADTRRRWLAGAPGYDMPAHVDPPFHRDSLLPQDEAEVDHR